MSLWINHAKKEAKRLGLSYPCALTDKRVQNSYKPTKLEKSKDETEELQKIYANAVKLSQGLTEKLAEESNTLTDLSKRRYLESLFKTRKYYISDVKKKC